jgi:DNA replication protein DnaC
MKKANENARFKEITAELATLEIDIAKAEVRAPEKLPALEEKKAALLQERKSLLAQMGISEKELSLQFECQKCQDTGFLPSGLACSCYKPEV